MIDQTHSKEPKAFYIGLDIGGTKCAIVLGDDNFKIYKKVFFKTKVERGPAVILDEFKQHIYRIFEKYDRKKLVKIGISCGGPLNSKMGLIKSPPNLPGWDNIPIVDILAKEADWRSSLATSTQRNIDESILIDSVSNTAFLLIKLIDLLRTNGGVSQSDIDTLDTKTKQTYIDMKDAISRLRP
ncbi:hypothetical protein LCGC14_0189830 [marine sediment metagenome]|uniref:ROK family protein n=1 Tax=marine sediment metagenome TaxID=412755 RepID=A0A0F9UR56_9ZZZZ